MVPRDVLAIGIEKALADFELHLRELKIAERVHSVAHAAEISNFDQAISIILVSIYEPLNQELLAKFTSLKAIVVLGTSTAKIDTAYCEAHDIQLLRVTSYCDEETAEWVVGHIINFFRGLGPFESRAAKPSSVHGKTLGLIGVGAVGECVLSLAHALGMRVMYHARGHKPHLGSAQFASIEEIFHEADVVSLHTPPHVEWLTSAQMSLLKPHALLINTCMGRVSRENSLEEFLSKRSDVSVVMDGVAAKSYPQLSHAVGTRQMAYWTRESEQRVKDKFWAHVQLITKK
jgi:lactate dehydrogenase-like 2-hydroxyacid dehydrogenase